MQSWMASGLIAVLMLQITSKSFTNNQELKLNAALKNYIQNVQDMFFALLNIAAAVQVCDATMLHRYSQARTKKLPELYCFYRLYGAHKNSG